ncbi:MAG: NAD(P)-dependent oxidoreductase [Devosia nanyangense]|uniref:NAD(P)-dependent oxidoreductase n=1 Tax=Devosia nanyangense TaxID=1228055 RepID=A0A933NXN7_9HYPH|nr:NAD(P)-dependent oxidoreductase [Devosia nanyangense]
MAPTANKPKVLITGASGLIGSLVIRDLSNKYEFSGLSRRVVPDIKHTQAEIGDPVAIRKACEGMDMVLHLAAETQDYDDWDKVMSNTIGGTLNMYRAAQEAGVKRVVFMSTGSTMCGYEWYEGSPYGKLAANELQALPPGEKMITYLDPPRPDSFYGVGKLFGENTGRLFSDRYGMSVICIRLGAVLQSDRPEIVRHFPGYLAQADAVQMVDKCLGAPDSIRFDIFDAISDNSRRWRDTSHAKEVLGWRPTGSSDRFDIEAMTS